jgi:hypothetical protein
MGAFREFTHSWLFIILAGSLLAWLLHVFVVWPLRRWQNAPRVTACPLCGQKPPKLLFSNRCSQCGCEYDQWGKIAEHAKTPAQRNDLNHARVAALEDEIAVRQGAAEWKNLGQDRFRAQRKPSPNPRSEQYQPGSSQDLMP